MQNMEEMMKAAQEAAERIQTQMNEAQAKLDTIEVEGSSGGGLVKIRASAKGRILSVAEDGCDEDDVEDECRHAEGY